MSEKLESIRKFLNKHRALIASGMTATAFLLLMVHNAKQLEEFMKDHDLLEEYHQWLLPEE